MMSPKQASAAEVICPHCGHRFRLTDQVMDHVYETWSRREGQRLRRELAKELAAKAEEDAEPKIRRQYEATLREREEEIRGKDRKLRSLQRKLEEAGRKAGQGDAQALGDVRQEGLAEALASRFGEDEVRPVARGRAGADVIQIVMDGRRAYGTILWESKRTSEWRKAWIAKLKSDQRRESADVAVIVSDARPDPDLPFASLDGVLVTSPEAAPHLATLLRGQIIAVARARGTKARRDDLKGALYDYVTSTEFAEHFRGVIAAVVDMKSTLDRERRALASVWKAREHAIDTVVEHLAEVHGDLRGIGAALPPISGMDLPGGDVPELPA